MKTKYTQQQVALLLHGIEAKDDFSDIAKATGMKLLTVASYAGPKYRKWVEARARGDAIPRKNAQAKQTTGASKVFDSPILNEIFERLTPQQRKRFEAAMVEVVLRQAFLP